ncbi:MAG: hypothetical protein ND807_09225 [Vicinamibacterales bacterium]|nr:hypothetical protein [Vicinamibacterales bacterium]
MNVVPRRPQARTVFVSALVLGLAMVGGGEGTVTAQVPDPCALLTVDEIQQLTMEASAGDGVSSSLESVRTAACRYAWGAGVNRLKLDVVIKEASQMFPGMNPDQVKQRLLESAKAGTADAVIPDVGEAAVFTSESPYYASATAALKGRIVAVHVDGRIARERKDQVIALLKAAVSRL